MSRAFLLLLCLPTSFLLIASAAGSRSNVSSLGFLIAALKGAHSVAIVDPDAQKQIAVIDETGITVHEVTASPDGKTVYAPIYGNSGVGKPGTDGQTLVAIDVATRKIVNTLDFGHGVRPHCPLFGPKDGMLYVTTELDQTISVVDPKTLKVVGAIPTGQPESHMFVISHDGTRGYTANVGPGTVSVLDIQNRKVLKVIPVSGQTQRISVSFDDSMVFTADQTKPQLAVIDTATNDVKHWVKLPGYGYGTAPTPDGRWLVVAVPSTKQVAIVDLKTMEVAHTIDVPRSPQESLVRPDGQMAYVSCDASNQIAAIRTSDWKLEKLIDVGKGVDGLAWAK